MDWFWYMIAGVVVLGITALITALYMWKLYKDFPESMKAKVVSVESCPINEYKNGYKYHFKGRNKGNRMMTDYVTYKDKKFKVGEKTTVRMSKNGQTCHSNFPLWPAVTSAICILLAFVLVFAYVSDQRGLQANSGLTGEEMNAFENDAGTFIVTDTDVLFEGEKLGLVIIDGDTSAVSTGDYGFIFYQGEPHYESEDADLPCVHSISMSVLTDGTADTLDAALVDEVNNMGYTINTVATNYAELTGTNTTIEGEGAEHVEGDGHNHSQEVVVDGSQVVTSPSEEITAETEGTNTESSVEPEAEPTGTTTNDVIEFVTEPSTSNAN